MAEWLSTQLSGALASGSLAMFFFVFASGVAASFTPCTYPVLPLTVGFIGAQAGGSRSRALLLSLALVLGMALVYGVVGAVFSALGLQMGAIWGNGWAVFSIAVFFLVMSLFLLEVFTFPTPRFLGRLQGSAGTNRQGILGAFVVGGVSGLVVGPCTGPILAVVLGVVAISLQESSGMAFVYQAAKGGLLLFLFGLGQGTLILLCGVSAGFLSGLPKSGQWLITIRKAFAMLIIAGSCLLLVYVGQATDFPDLTRMLSGIEQRDDAPPTGVVDESDRFGGDEFLD